MKIESLTRCLAIVAAAGPGILVAPGCSRGEATAARLAIQLDDALKEKKALQEQKAELAEKLEASEAKFKAIQDGGEGPVSAKAAPPVLSQEKLLQRLQTTISDRRAAIISDAEKSGYQLMQIGLPVSITIPEIAAKPYNAVITLRLQQAGRQQDVAIPVHAGWDGEWHIPASPLTGLTGPPESTQASAASAIPPQPKKPPPGIELAAEIKNSDFGGSSRTEAPPQPALPAPGPKPPSGPKPPPSGINPVGEIKDSDFRPR